MLALGPESVKQPGLRLQGEGCPPGREPLGEQMGRKMAAAWAGGGRGACAITSSTIPTHTLAFGQSQGLKIATTSSSAISRASYPTEPAVPGPDPKGPGMLCLSWDAQRQGATGATQQGGKDQVRAVLVTGPFSAF